MPKQLEFSSEARAKMKRGIDIMADTVGVPLWAQKGSKRGSG
ncbi:MAG: hypothetical protein CM1200mP38_6230 [Dehalococcoidia bacterium]|nr:MAG: hypothetical protein CM1200mP38_6230 [Dehalococcoidia bacterium]